MKSITPVDIWHEGSLKEVSKLDASISYDDLKTNATFRYTLLHVVEAIVPDPLPENYVAPLPMYISIARGEVYIGGTDYENWDNSNEAAYEFVADKLNLTIEPDPAP